MRGPSPNQLWRERNAVTPAVAIVLMLALTVTMVVVAVPLVLTESTQVTDQRPDVDVAFAYTEDVEPDEADTFGRNGTVSGVDADGQLTIRFESGESVPATQLNVSGAASSGNLVTDTSNSEFTDDQYATSGSELTVWAARGETVQILWTSPDGEESAILDEFTIRPVPS